MTNSQKRLESYRISRENDGKNRIYENVKTKVEIVQYAKLRERLGCQTTAQFRILDVWQVCDYF